MDEMHLTLDEKQIVHAMGDDADDFLEVFSIISDIIDKPEKYSGMKALVLANQLAAYRTKMAIKANWLKSQERSITNRQKKDVLLAMEHNLVENINVLKMMGRIDGRAAGLL